MCLLLFSFDLCAQSETYERMTLMWIITINLSNFSVYHVHIYTRRLFIRIFDLFRKFFVDVVGGRVYFGMNQRWKFTAHFTLIFWRQMTEIALHWFMCVFDQISDYGQDRFGFASLEPCFTDSLFLHRVAKCLINCLFKIHRIVFLSVCAGNTSVWSDKNRNKMKTYKKSKKIGMYKKSVIINANNICEH